MSANRVAAIAGFIASLSALALAAAGAFPGRFAPVAVAVAAVLAKTVIVLKFLSGSQASEARHDQ